MDSLPKILFFTNLSFTTASIGVEIVKIYNAILSVKLLEIKKEHNIRRYKFIIRKLLISNLFLSFVSLLKKIQIEIVKNKIKT